jgi:hypothetical protein
MLQQTLVISMFQLAYEKEPARTRPAALKPKADKVWGWNQFLPSCPEDCEPSVEPEDFGKGGVEVEPEDCGKGGAEVEPEDFGRGGVEVEPEDSGKGGVGAEVESEYDLELRIGGNVGRLRMGHLSLLTAQTVRW